jgi:hypothetical protein
MTFLEKIFIQLMDNKQFPYYQAERRIDIFINTFIEPIVQQNTKFKDAIYLAAEFPLKKDLTTDHAAHIDYLMYSKDFKRILFVELKTDNKSYSEKQVLFYESNPSFMFWYQHMLKIKMKGFEEKKQYLVDVIEKKVNVLNEDLAIETIILQPTVNNTNEIPNRHYIQLKDLDIDTDFFNEWQIFKTLVLSNLTKQI